LANKIFNTKNGLNRPITTDETTNQYKTLPRKLREERSWAW